MPVSLFSEIRASKYQYGQENASWLRGTTAFWGFRQVYEVKYRDISTVYLKEVQQAGFEKGGNQSWGKIFCRALWVAACISLVVPVIMFVGLLIYRALNDFEQLPQFSVKKIGPEKKDIEIFKKTLKQVLAKEEQGWREQKITIDGSIKRQFIAGILIKEIARQDIKYALDLVNEYIISLPAKKRLVISIAKDLLETNIDLAFDLYRQLRLEKSDLEFSREFFECALKKEKARAITLLELEKFKNLWHTNEPFASMMIDLLIAKNRKQEAEALALEVLKFYASKPLSFITGYFKSELFFNSIISLNSSKVIAAAIKFFDYENKVYSSALRALDDLENGFKAAESLSGNHRIQAFILITKALSKVPEKMIEAENAQKRATQELKLFLSDENIFSFADRSVLEFLLNADEDLTIMKGAYEAKFKHSIRRGVLCVVFELMKGKEKKGFKEWFADCYSNLSEIDQLSNLSLVYEGLDDERKKKGLKDLMNSDIPVMLVPRNQIFFSEAWKLFPQEFSNYLVKESCIEEFFCRTYEYSTYSY